MSRVNRRRAGACLAVTGLVLLLAGYRGDAGSGGGVQSAGAVEWTARIDSVPLLTIGDDPNDPLHQVIGVILVGDTLIIAQTSSASLRFYDRHTGEFLKRVGRRGDGPGEYWWLLSLQRVGNRLYTYDAHHRRVTVHDLSGALERTVDFEYWGTYGSPDFVGAFADGSFLVAAELQAGRPGSPMFRRSVNVLGRYDANGVFVDSLGYYLGGELFIAPLADGGELNSVPPPYSRLSSAGVIGDGYYILDNKEAMIPVFDRFGTLLREIGPDKPPEPVRISRRDRARLADYRDRIRDGNPGVGDIDLDQFPRFYPFYGKSTVVDGAFWVLDYLDTERDDARMAWTVYSHEGELLGRVSTEEKLSVRAVDGDVAVVVHHGGWNVETVQLRRLVKER